MNGALVERHAPRVRMKKRTIQYILYILGYVYTGPFPNRSVPDQVGLRLVYELFFIRDQSSVFDAFVIY